MQGNNTRTQVVKFYGLAQQFRPTKRAPDAGDSAAIPSSFLRLSIFLAGRLRRPHPSAGIPYRGRWRQPLGG